MNIIVIIKLGIISISFLSTIYFLFLSKKNIIKSKLLSVMSWATFLFIIGSLAGTNVYREFSITIFTMALLLVIILLLEGFYFQKGVLQKIACLIYSMSSIFAFITMLQVPSGYDGLKMSWLIFILPCSLLTFPHGLYVFFKIKDKKV